MTKHDIFKLINIILLLLISALLFACSNGKCYSNTSVGDVNNLMIIAPRVVLSSGKTNTASIVIQNFESTQVTGISYKINSVAGSGNKITINTNSAKKCSVIAANNFCILNLNVPNQLPAGSFSVHLDNGKSKRSDNNQQVIGVQSIVANELKDADGISLYYTPTVLSGTKYTIVSGGVTSAHTGKFNYVKVVDSRGNPIPNQIIVSSNLGAGFPNLTYGEVFEILIPITSKSNGNQVLKIKTFEVNNMYVESLISMSTASYIINTESNKGILDSLPVTISLESAQASQTLTFYNIGNKDLTINSISSSSSNINIGAYKKTISAGDTINVTLEMLDTNLIGTTSYLIINGTSNGEAFNSLVTIYQNISSVSPRPNPNPSPSPVPIAGIAINMSSPSFITNTQIGSVSQFVTLINTGNTPESNFTFDFRGVSGFNLSELPLFNNSCHIIDNTVMNTLNFIGNNSSCVALLTWSPGNTVLPPQLVSYQINYDYGYVLKSASPQYLVTANYLASANLILTPDIYNFMAIINNGESFNESEFILNNTGDATATELNADIKSIEQFPNIFTLSNAQTTPCGNSLAAGNACDYTVKFGPWQNAGDKSNKLSSSLAVTYQNGSSSSIESAGLFGIINESGNINLTISSTQQLMGGNGSLNAPYLAPVSPYATYIIIFQVTNNSDDLLKEFFVSINDNYMGNWNLNSQFTTCPINIPRKSYNLLNKNHCNVAIQAKFPNALGLSSFNPMAFSANWGKNNSSQITSNPVYINVYQSISSELSQPIYGIPASILTPITVTFTAPVKNVNTTTVTLNTYTGTPTSMTLIGNSGNSYTFQPNSPLIPGIPYLVNTSSAITDMNSLPLEPNQMEFNTANDVINWTQVQTPTQPLIATTAPDGTLFYSDKSGDVYMQQSNGNFSNIAHFHKTDSNPGITTLNVGYFPNQAPSPYTIFIGTGTIAKDDDNKMYQYIVGDGSNIVILADFNTFLSPKSNETDPPGPNPGPPPGTANWPTAAAFNFPSNNLAGGYIYYSNINGNFFYNNAGGGGLLPASPFADMEDNYATYSIAITRNPLDNNNIYFYAISTYQTIFTDDYPNLHQLWACQPFAKDQCNAIFGYNGAGMLTTDNTNNLYAGWFDGSVYKYSLTTLESTAFVVGTNTSAPINDVNTQVAWDNAHNQLLVYNFYPNYSIKAYSTNGDDIPFITQDLPGNGLGVKQVSPFSYNYRNTTTLIPNGNGPMGSYNTVYFLSESGVLYYVAY